MINNLVTYAVADLSTAHMTQADSELLSRRHNDADFLLNTVPTEFGFLVYVHMLHADAEKQEILRSYGLSTTFITACLAASQRGCKWADFDCDGVIYDTLPREDW